MGVSKLVSYGIETRREKLAEKPYGGFAIAFSVSPPIGIALETVAVLKIWLGVYMCALRKNKKAERRALQDLKLVYDNAYEHVFSTSVYLWNSNGIIYI